MAIKSVKLVFLISRFKMSEELQSQSQASEICIEKRYMSSTA
jgi:hypothetical protein